MAKERSHGTTSTYDRYKCRCDECVAAKRAAQARYKAKLEAAPREESEIPHGTASAWSWHKCRCEVCMAWKKAKDRAYYERNADQIKAQANAYYQANKERVVPRNSAYKKANRARFSEQERLKYQENPEPQRQRYRKYQQSPKGRLYAKASKARRRGIPYTDEAMAWIASLSDPLCAYCGAPATTIDHILPVTKGGTGELANLAPACRSCNSAKGNRSLAEFLQRRTKET